MLFRVGSVRQRYLAHDIGTHAEVGKQRFDQKTTK